MKTNEALSAFGVHGSIVETSRDSAVNELATILDLSPKNSKMFLQHFLRRAVYNIELAVNLYNAEKSKLWDLKGTRCS